MDWKSAEKEPCGSEWAEMGKKGSCRCCWLLLNGFMCVHHITLMRLHSTVMLLPTTHNFIPRRLHSLSLSILLKMPNLFTALHKTRASAASDLMWETLTVCIFYIYLYRDDSDDEKKRGRVEMKFEIYHAAMCIFLKHPLETSCRVLHTDAFVDDSTECNFFSTLSHPLRVWWGC